MVIRMDASPSGVTIWLSGELDHHAARSLREQIDGAVDRTGAKRLRLDFEGVTFMDSSGIGLVMGRYRLMPARRRTAERDGRVGTDPENHAAGGTRPAAHFRGGRGG